MLKKVARSARRTENARRSNRSRRLLLESLESRQLMAVTNLSVVAPPASVNEGQPLTLTLTYSDPAGIAGNYTALVDWGDGTAREAIPLFDQSAGGELLSQITRTYADDTPTVTPTDPRNITVAVFNDADPVAHYWQFNSAPGGVTPDSLGANPGTLGTGATLVPGTGIGGAAIAFNGGPGATVNVGATAPLNTGLAIEALVRPTGVLATENREIMRKEDGNNRYLFSFQGRPLPADPTSRPILSFGTNINGGYSELDMPLDSTTRISGVFLDPPAPGVAQSGDVILKDGNYHHLVATYDEATGRRSIYIDGVERFFDTFASPSRQIATVVGGVPAFIGSTGNSNEFFSGIMDEVAFYTRAITPAEITDHYTRFLGGENYFFETVTTAVNNVAPAFDLGADANLSEGGTLNRPGSFTDVPADTFTATVDYGDGTGVQPLTLVGNNFTLNRQYANSGAYTVTVTINDDDSGSTTDTFTVNVANVAPTVNTPTGTTPINEGGTASISATFTDPALNETYTATINWGDGNITAGTVNPVTETVTGSHPYADQGTFNVTVTVNDGTDSSTSAPFVITVNNVLPVLGAVTGSTPVNEGSNATISVGYTDPGTADAHTATINWGDGVITNGTVDQATDTVTGLHAYVQNGSYQVVVTVNDGTGNSAPSAPFTIVVNNVQPTVDAGPVITGNEASPVTLNATFVDPGTADTHNYTINWGDGTIVSGMVAAGLRTITGNHTYANNGDFTVTVTVTDGESAVVSDTTTAEIADVAPIVEIMGPDLVVRGQPNTFVFSVTDPSPVDFAQNYAYTINWGDGTPTQTLSGPSENFEVVHIFPAASAPGSTFTITASATDFQMNEGPDATFDVTVSVFEVVNNPDTQLDDLVIGGTPLADRIIISMQYAGGIQVRINNVTYRDIPDFDGKVIVFGGDGGDTIQIAGSVPYDFELYGGNGNDYIAGGRFNDLLDGGAGNDRLLDIRGDNTFIGGAGNDQISGGTGIDIAFGGLGNDRISGGAGNDILDGEEGNDAIDGGFDDDVLFGGAGNDNLVGYYGNDILLGGLGNDRLTGNSGRDVMIGGRGSDSFYGGLDDDLMVHSHLELGNTGSEFERDEDVAELRAISEDWLLPVSIDERIAILSEDDPDGRRDGLNSTTIEDDNSRESIFGDNDEDWFLVASLLEIRRLFPNDRFTIV